jgi:hypothetical protein
LQKQSRQGNDFKLADQRLIFVIFFTDFRLPDDLKLEATIHEAQHSVHLFFNNKFDEARALLEPL